MGLPPAFAAIARFTVTFVAMDSKSSRAFNAAAVGWPSFLVLDSLLFTDLVDLSRAHESIFASSSSLAQGGTFISLVSAVTSYT